MFRGLVSAGPRFVHFACENLHERLPPHTTVRYRTTVKRYIDGAITKFWIVLLGTTFGLFAVIGVWVGLTSEGLQAPYLNVAFVVSWLISLLLLIPVFWLMKNRPADKAATWGEAMVGSVYVFFLLFWIYGTVPHQWLTFAEAELNWRSDAFLIGFRTPWDSSQGVLEWALPFDITYATLKDLIAVAVYGVGLVANVAVFVMWQKRGDTISAPELESQSRYGRPIVKAADKASAAKVGV